MGKHCLTGDQAGGGRKAAQAMALFMKVAGTGKRLRGIGNAVLGMNFYDHSHPAHPPTQQEFLK